ncbi:T9SS type A sorting domain-containing protein [candidate division WOR-3 bacterium]|nr:T9SS type A sorting domain-containing protein [candidate division WOR-3 bacterium]
MNGGYAGLYRFSPEGDSLWLKYYPPRFPGHSSFRHICQTLDGEYVATGGWVVYEPHTTNAREIIAKIGPLGNLRWIKFYDCTDENGIDFSGLCPTPDSGFAVTVVLDKENGNEWETHWQLWKFDRAGNLLWTKEYPPLHDSTLALLRLQKSSDGGFILGCRVELLHGLTLTSALVKTDRLGNIQWISVFNDTALDRAVISDLCETADSGYVACGPTAWSEKMGTWAWKVDRWGNEQWRYVLPHIRYPLWYLWTVTPASDGGCVVGGRCELTPYYALAKLIRFNRSGEVVWVRDFGTPDSNHFSDIYCAETALDGGFLFSGYLGNYNCFVKTDSLGMVHPGIAEQRKNLKPRVQPVVFPNPVRKRAFIHYYAVTTGRFSLVVNDAAGRQVGQWEFDVPAGPGVFNWEAKGLSPGIYFLGIKTPDACTKVKVLLLK